MDLLMKKTSRILALLLSLVAVFSLFGCGSKDSGDSNDGSDSSDDGTVYTISGHTPPPPTTVSLSRLRRWRLSSKRLPMAV